MRKHVFTLAAATLFAGSAAHAQFGDIIFTNELTDSIDYIADPGGSNTLSTLYTFTGVGADFRPGRIIQLPGGDYVVSNQPLPVLDPSTASLERVTDLFGVPSHATIASSDPIQNPNSLVYRADTNQVLTVNNPGSAFNLPLRFEGILGVDPDTGVITEIFEYDPFDDPPRPRYQAGGALGEDPFSDMYYNVSRNGGEYFTGQPGDENQGSQIYMFDAVAGTVDLAVDLSFVAADPITTVAGMVVLPGDNAGWRDVFISDLETTTIYKLRFDDTNTFVDISTVLDGLTNPSGLSYNPFLDKLVWASPTSEEVWQANLDGTGLEMIASGVLARGFEFIPAPSSVGLLGLGGILALRRRR
jgi:hypothetical protein